MKKQPQKIKKLQLQKETLAALELEQAIGGSNLYNTVYYPRRSADNCTDCPIVWA